MRQYTVENRANSTTPALIRTLKLLLNETGLAKTPLTVDETIDRATMLLANQVSTLNSLGGTATKVNTRALVYLAKTYGGGIVAKSLTPNLFGPIPNVPKFLDLMLSTPSWLFRLFYSPGEDNSKRTINNANFLTAYRENFPEYLPPGTAWETNFTRFCDFVAGDAAISDSRWSAYLFATAMHEGRAAADKWKATWNPVSETGGSAKSYGGLQTVTDWDGTPLNASGQRISAAAKNGPSIQRSFYGRGYVQITHQDNYRAMDEALSQGNLLVTDPEKTIREPQLSYNILSYGLRNGSFRGTGRSRTPGLGYTGGHKLSDFLNANSTDYVRARQIVNGDLGANGQKIADYALTFKAMLEATVSI